jgi:3-oxoacyl-[acyl-carrier-protein] synthase-3
MSQSVLAGVSIRGIATSVPCGIFDNLRDTTVFPADDVRKVVAMAGVNERRVVDGTTCSTDLCLHAADALLHRLGWQRDSIDGLIMVTQTPDYFMPSSSSVAHKRLGLAEHCAAFDVGLGCSGYPYGLWLAWMMLGGGGLQRVLLLHGETPTRYAAESDRAVSLLFGDAGSATALERDEGAAATKAYFALRTDGTGCDDLIIEAGGFRDRFSKEPSSHFVRMNGANVFNFTIKAVPPLIQETLGLAGRAIEDVDYYVLHQSNRFIIKHLMTTCALPAERVPIVLDRFGNSGGPSVPLTVTQGLPDAGRRPLWMMLIGYGAGLSWGAALVRLPEGAAILHLEHDPRAHLVS